MDGKEFGGGQGNVSYHALFSDRTALNGRSVMVLAGINSEAKTELVLVENALTANRYILQILAEHVVPFKPEAYSLLLTVRSLTFTPRTCWRPFLNCTDVVCRSRKACRPSKMNL